MIHPTVRGTLEEYASRTSILRREPPLPPAFIPALLELCLGETLHRPRPGALPQRQVFLGRERQHGMEGVRECLGRRGVVAWKEPCSLSRGGEGGESVRTGGLAVERHDDVVQRASGGMCDGNHTGRLVFGVSGSVWS